MSRSIAHLMQFRCDDNILGNFIAASFPKAASELMLLVDSMAAGVDADGLKLVCNALATMCEAAANADDKFSVVEGSDWDMGAETVKLIYSQVELSEVAEMSTESDKWDSFGCGDQELLDELRNELVRFFNDDSRRSRVPAFV